MASRGWENVTPSDLQRMQREPQGAKPSKYKNVRVEVDGVSFDSKREAGEYLRLKARLLAGEISELRRQVVFPLFAPMLASGGSDARVEVARYIADFTYQDLEGRVHVVDAKGKRTALYALKAKWLNLQNGIAIEEV